jgi:thioredoxin 1
MRRAIIILAFATVLLLAWQNVSAKKTPVKPMITFVELGSVNCIPCKMMKPVMEAVEKEYGDTVKVVFYDVWKPEHKDKSSRYKVRVIPTQVFLDKDGKEFHRHEGFYSKAEIKKVIDKQLGVD